MPTPPSNASAAVATIDKLESYVAEQLTLVHELKRQVADKERERQDQLRDFLLGQIELLDAMEQKDDNLRERYQEAPEALKVIVSYRFIQKRLLRQLERYGVSRVTFPEGRLIVGLSKVVETEPDSTKANDSIISIVSHGYMRGSTVLASVKSLVQRLNGVTPSAALPLQNSAFRG